MRLGKTLQDVKELSKKQSKKKNYAGWFQSFGGEAPINNAFFNMAMGSADGIAGAGEADGGVGITASMGESLSEDYGNAIIKKVAEHFGTYNIVPKWKTFILPDGRFLNMDGLRSHAFVEQWLIDNGLSDVKYAYISDGSPTLSRLGCFRCSPKGHYCILTDVDFPEDEALNSLLLWLDKQSSETDSVHIVSTNGKTVIYKFDDYSSDDILSRVERYYSSGILYEKQCEIHRAGNARYRRGKVGEKLSLEKLTESVRNQKEKEFLGGGRTKIRYKRLPIGGKLAKVDTPKNNYKTNKKEKGANTTFGATGKPIMENYIAFQVSDGFSHKNDKEVSVSVKDVVKALMSLLRYDTNYIDMDGKELKDEICNNLDSYVDTYYGDLCEVFCKDNECEEKEESNDYEEDPFLLQYTFDRIDSDDPDIEVTEYEYNSPYDFDEDWDSEDYDEDEDSLDRYERMEGKTVYDSDGFTTDYILYYDTYEEKYFTMFGDEDFYEPSLEYADAEFDTYAEAKEWFDNYEGFTDEDDDEEEYPFDECVHPTIKMGYYKKPTNPLSKVKDTSYYDDDMEYTSRVTESGIRAKNKAFSYDDNPINEGEMSELDIERQEDPELLDHLRKEIDDLNNELDFLKNQAPKEIRRGGAFDSQYEIDDAIKATERELKRTTAKYKILLRSQNS